jgi:MFS family permease
MTVFGRLAKYFKPENLFSFGLLFTSVGILGIGNKLSVPLIITFALLLGLAYSAVLPSWNTIMSNNIDPSNKGLMWGGFSTIEGIGRALGPLSGGIVGKYFGLQFSFDFSGIILLGLALFYFYLNKNHMLRHQQD